MRVCVRVSSPFGLERSAKNARRATREVGEEKR